METLHQWAKQLCMVSDRSKNRARLSCPFSGMADQCALLAGPLMEVYTHTSLCCSYVLKSILPM